MILSSALAERAGEAGVSEGFRYKTQSHPDRLSPGRAQPQVRRDVVDSHGKLTLRHADRLHHIGVGGTHAEPPS